MMNAAFPFPEPGVSLHGSGPSLPLRTTLAVREFVRGNVTLPEASRLAGMDSAGFIELLSELEWLGPRSTGRSPWVSVVVPVYNEEKNLTVLYERLCRVLSGVPSFEILFVDDGSRDGSAAIIAELQCRDPRVKLLGLSRNFGHQAALSAGIDHACGDAIILMDADLQDPPELLPVLLAQWEAGYEVVYAVRQKRDDGLFKRATAGLFYRLLRRMSYLDIPLDAGDFCLMDRKVAEVLRRLPEKNRFLRGLRSWAGFKQVGVAYERPPRHAGEPKYTLRKMVRLAADGVMAFTALPLRLVSFLGVLTASAGMAYLGVAVFARVLTGSIPRGWTSLVAITLIIGGAQLIVTGLLGAYIARIYDETKARPMYVLADRHATDRQQIDTPSTSS